MANSLYQDNNSLILGHGASSRPRLPHEIPDDDGKDADSDSKGCDDSKNDASSSNYAPSHQKGTSGFSGTPDDPNCPKASDSFSSKVSNESKSIGKNFRRHSVGVTGGSATINSMPTPHYGLKEKKDPGIFRSNLGLLAELDAVSDSDDSDSPPGLRQKKPKKMEQVRSDPVRQDKRRPSMINSMLDKVRRMSTTVDANGNSALSEVPKANGNFEGVPPQESKENGKGRYSPRNSILEVEESAKGNSILDVSSLSPAHESNGHVTHSSSLRSCLRKSETRGSEMSVIEVRENGSRRRNVSWKGNSDEPDGDGATSPVSPSSASGSKDGNNHCETTLDTRLAKMKKECEALTSDKDEPTSSLRKFLSSTSSLLQSRISGRSDANKENESDSQNLSSFTGHNQKAAGKGRGCRRWIHTPAANIIFGSVICINAVFLGIEADHNNSEEENTTSPSQLAWFICDSVFLGIFTFELLLRFVADLCSMFRDPWNVFDFLLVAMGILDTWIMGLLQVGAQEGSGVQQLTVLRIARLARLFRILRLVRIFRFLRELMLLVQGILGALKALGWTVFLILLVLYTSAVLITNTIGHATEDPEISEWFGTVGGSFLTLFQLMTLEEWPSVVRTVINTPKFRPAWLFFIPFIMLTSFILLNLVTAVVVERIIAVAQQEASGVAKREEKERKKAIKQIKKLFYSIDTDGDGLLDIAEFRQALDNTDILQQFLNLGITKYDADDLFDCFDVDGNSELSLAEFVDGCMRMQGSAKAKHLLQVQYDVTRCRRSTKDSLDAFSEQVEDLMQAMDSLLQEHKASADSKSAGDPSRSLPRADDVRGTREMFQEVLREELDPIRKEMSTLRAEVRELKNHQRSVKESDLLKDPLNDLCTKEPNAQ